MSDREKKGIRFKDFFSWGGVMVVFLGMVYIGIGSLGPGLLFVAAGVVAWLFAKRRSRASET